MRNSILAGVLVLLFFGACTKNEMNESEGLNAGSVQFTADYLQPARIDSFLSDRNSGLFYDRIPNLDRDLYLKNRIFLFSRSGVKVGLVDSTGNFIQQITQKGEGPGEIAIARSAKGWQNKKGEIYVLTNANGYSLYVYNADGSYRYVLRLYSALPEAYHPWGSSFDITEKEKGIYKLTMSIGSTSYDRLRKGFYEQSSAVAQFVINDDDERITSVNTFMPYKDLPKIKNALASESVCWSGNEARFQVVGANTYLTFPFSEKVYVLNEDFEIKDTYDLKFFKQYSTGYCLPMTEKLPETTYERTYDQYHAYLGNAHISDLQVLGNLLIVQFVAPLPENEYLPKFPTRSQAQDISAFSGFFQKRDKYWLIYNTDNGNEQLIKLSPYHGKGIFLDEQRMLVEKTYPDNDDRYLMKYTLNSPLGSE